MKDLIIGIDPDVDKNGVAVYQKPTRGLQLLSLTFFELFDFLNQNKGDIREIVIEAGWKHKKSNFHNSHSGVGVAAKIGSRTGANHEVGRKIVEMCAYLSITSKEVMPLRKRWKGTDGKITQEEFKQITGYSKRNNQEMRDAGLLVWGY